ncbi:MAG: hypothetical protein R2849_21120 [Thermomicrobiales bacterium]
MNEGVVSRVRQGLTGKIKEPKVTVRTKMGEIAQEMDDVIAMGPGDPDLPTPRHIIAAAKNALDAGATHYTPPPATRDRGPRSPAVSWLARASHTTRLRRSSSPPALKKLSTWLSSRWSTPATKCLSRSTASQPTTGEPNSARDDRRVPDRLRGRCLQARRQRDRTAPD